MDAVSLCESQHRDILDRIAVAAAAPGPEAAVAVSRLVHALLAHLATEEQLLFPQLRSDRTAATLAGVLEDHRQLRKMTEELRRAAPHSPAYMRSIEELRTRAAAHFTLEEHEVLPVATNELEAEAREQLGSLMNERYLTLRGVEIRFVDLGAAPEAAPPLPESEPVRRRDR